MTLICWGVVIVTWIVEAMYGARRARGRHQRARGGALWQFGAFVAAFVFFRFISGGLRAATDHSWWTELPGLVLLVASTGFTIWARLSLGGMWSASPDVLRADHELRTDGPYAITRHPIYTGLFGMLLGTVLASGLGVTLAFLVVGRRLPGRKDSDRGAVDEHGVPRGVRSLPRACAAACSRPPPTPPIALKLLRALGFPIAKKTAFMRVAPTRRFFLAECRIRSGPFVEEVKRRPEEAAGRQGRHG